MGHSAGDSVVPCRKYVPALVDQNTTHLAPRACPAFGNEARHDDVDCVTTWSWISSIQ